MAKKSAARRRRPGSRATARTRVRPKARAAKRTARRPARRKPAAKRRMKSRGARRTPARKASKGPGTRAARPGKSTQARIERPRRRLPDAERTEAARPTPDARMVSAARSGRNELKAQLGRHNETSPALTAGDLDAKWQDAYAIGDEAPGGDNPTPGQDRVDEIGRALGVNYQDNEELQGGDEITERDEHRWELDPASSEDWPHKKEPDEDE